MRTLMGILSAVITTITACASFCSAQLLSNPESIVFDTSRNCCYVSNWGDGNIVCIDRLNEQTVFSDTLPRLAALLLCGDTLFAASNDTPMVGIAGFDVNTREMILFIPVAGSGLVNDLALDGEGFMYVTDFWSNRLYKIDLARREAWIFVSEGLSAPNGMDYDSANRRLLISCQGNWGYPIKAVSIDDSTVSTVVYTYLGGVDGFVLDRSGRMFISSWQTNAIHRCDPPYTSPWVQVYDGCDGPADIALNPQETVLGIPNFNVNTVGFIEIEAAGVETPDPSPDYELSPVYPNPFNARTTLRYQLTTPEHVEVVVYDILGNVIATLACEVQNAGSHSLQWNADRQSSGVYFCRIGIGQNTSVQRLVLLR